MKILDVPQSGSTAGTTSSRNRFGQYRRTRAMPTQPRTPSQVANRVNLGANSNAWRTLTNEQRAAWQNYAAANPIVDTLGQTVVMTGHMMFNAINTRLALIGFARVSNPPAPGTELPRPAVTITSADFDNYFASVSPADPPIWIMFFSSPPKSTGVSFNGDYRYLGTIQADNTGVVDFNLDTTTAAKFGFIQPGQRYFVRWQYITTDGTWAEGDKVIVDITGT